MLQRDGQGGAVDAAGAARSFKLSCDAGLSDGCLEYGVAQYSGAGVAQDYAGARSSFAQACNTGNAGACMNAGMMARDGQGGAADPAAAKRLFDLPRWRDAKRIKVNPDSPQRPVRIEALRRGLEDLEIADHRLTDALHL